MEKLNDKIPKSLKSIFSPKSPSEQKNGLDLGSPHNRSPSTDFSLPEQSDKSFSLRSHGRSIGGFIKSHTRRSSSSGPLSRKVPDHILVDRQTESLVLENSALLSPVSFKSSLGTVPSPKTPTLSSPRTDLAALTEDQTTPPSSTALLPSPPLVSGNPQEESPSLNRNDASEPGEINDAAYDSDDHEEDEDVDNSEESHSDPSDSPDVLKNASRPKMGDRKLSRPHSHMDQADAESIIGGIATSDIVSPQADIITSHDHKTFSFSLPFSNPLAGLEFPNFKLPSIFSNEGTTTSFFSTSEEFTRLQLEVDDRLVRQLTVSSQQEDFVYNTVRQQDNSRLRAMRQAFTPNISIDSLNPLTPPKQDNFPAIEGDVVILGGYRGSILRDAASRRRVWIPIKAGFNLRKIDLTVGPKDEDEYEMIRKIYPDGMLTHIGPVDVSRKLIKKLRSSPKCKVYEFGYDWRLSSDINSERLCKFLAALPSNRNFDQEKHGGLRRKGAIVIAHSMGGLISHHAMQKNPSLFRGLLYAGVPSSCPNILGPLKHGDAVLLSSKILTQQVNFLMRSSYVFLPLDGRCFVDKKDTSIKYDIDFFDVKTWIKHELSPLVTKRRPRRRSTAGVADGGTFNVADIRNSLNNFTMEKLKGFTFTTDLNWGQDNKTTTFTLPDQTQLEYDEAVEYLDRTLKRTKKFLLELEYDETKCDLYPPLASLYGYSVPTLRGSKVDGEEGIRTDMYDDLLFGAGDGVIYHKWTMPEPKGFKVVAKIGTDRGHVGLLNDVDAVGRALEAILATEKLALTGKALLTVPLESLEIQAATIDTC